MDKNKTIRSDFLTGLLDIFEEYNDNAETDAEKELMYRLVLELNNLVGFTNED